MQIFQTVSVFTDQMRALPFEFCNTLVIQKTRIDGFNSKWKSLILHAAISIQYQHVTDRQTDRRRQMLLQYCEQVILKCIIQTA